VQLVRAQRAGEPAADQPAAVGLARGVDDPRSPDPGAALDGSRASLVRRADELCRDHTHLLDHAGSLSEEVRCAARAAPPSPWTGNGPHVLPGQTPVAAESDLESLRARVEKFLDALRKHEEAEAELILESVNTDIGVGD
jgi:hypothetical protein